MENEKKQIKINLDPVLYSLSNLSINFNEELFDFLMISGNQGRRFRLSPKHAKRVHLLLEKAMKEYETRFGKIEAQLSQKKESSNQERIGFIKE